MASLNLAGDYGGFHWSISGLGNPFNTTYYKAAALAAAYQGDGISSLTYVERRVATSSRTQYFTPSYWRTASPGTYTFYGYAQAANGRYYYCGAASVTVHKKEKIPYYTVDTIGYNNFDVNWFDTSDYMYLRIFVRTTGGTTVYDQWKSTGGRDGYVTITGLSPGTAYVVNVAYNTTTSATGSTWIGSQNVTTLSAPTYYYKIRYLLPNGTTLSTSSLYSEKSTSGSITVLTSKISAPSGYQKTGSYTAISGCSYSSSGSYFTVTTTNSSSPAILGVYVKENSYTLAVYDVYGGTAHYRDSYDLEAGYSFTASVYSSPPYGYEYDHAESPRGTRVTSVTMNTDRALYLFYTQIEPTTPNATITVTGRTENSLTVRANITNSLTHSDAWYLCISTTSSFSSYQSVQGSGSRITHTFAGLSPNTTYYFKVINVYNEQQAWQSDYATGTTRRAAFAWDHNDNLDNRRPTANEWTRLVSFVETVAGVTVSAAAKETIYVGGTLSHILFNELAQDVSLAQTVSKGASIFKSVLNALRDKANTLR